jgi:hypothetical protein
MKGNFDFDERQFLTPKSKIVHIIFIYVIINFLDVCCFHKNKHLHSSVCTSTHIKQINALKPKGLKRDKSTVLGF